LTGKKIFIREELERRINRGPRKNPRDKTLERGREEMS